jgi:hypothetical protein
MQNFERGTYRLLLSSLITLYSLSGMAQLKSVKLYLDAGAAVPTNKDLSEVFTTGVNLYAGAELPLMNQRLFVQPIGGMKWYFKEITQENSLTEHFRTWKAGVAFSYNLVSIKQINISPLIRFDYNWSSNYYSETYNYDFYSNTSSVALSDKYLKGTGISYDLGIKLQKKKWYLKIDHEFFKPVLNVNEQLRSEAYGQGFLIPATYTYNMNSLNLTIGYQIIPLR